MSIFKKDIPNVDQLRRKKNYNKLIKLLNHNDPSIVHKAETALCELKYIARDWLPMDYDRVLKKLESNKLSKSRNAIDPFIQTLKKERYVQEEIEQAKQNKAAKFKDKLQQTSFSSLLSGHSIENLKEIMQPNEKIEYDSYAGVGTSWFGSCHYLITDRQLIFVDFGLMTQNIKYLPYDDITSVMSGLKSIKFYVGEKVAHKISNEVAAAIIPHLAKFISLDRKIVKKFIPAVYHENIELYTQILNDLKDPCSYCFWSISKGKNQCVECSKKFYSSPETIEADKDLEKIDEWVCKCGTSNPISLSNCSNCHVFKGNVVPRTEW